MLPVIFVSAMFKCCKLLYTILLYRLHYSYLTSLCHSLHHPKPAFADKNPMPMCSAIEFSGPVLPYVKAQLKLAETTRIRAVAKSADGKIHVAFREIKVTLGGCGG